MSRGGRAVGNHEKILIVEDESKIARFLELELSYEGYEVSIEYNGLTGFKKSQSAPFDIILLDVMLPHLSGMELCRRIRKTSDVPIIMLTARGEVTDKVMGLDLGADDYLTKPFEIEELLARIRAALRRKETRGSEVEELAVQMLRLNRKTRKVFREKTEIELTKREFELLEYLMVHAGAVISRKQILEDVWELNYYNSTNSVDVYIRYLREKIDAHHDKKYIQTVRGFGYVIYP